MSTAPQIKKADKKDENKEQFDFEKLFLIKGFPNYRFDKEKDAVVTLFAKTYKLLKWYIYPKTKIRRVSLYKEGMPVYLMEPDLKRLVEEKAELVIPEKAVKQKKEKKEKKEKVKTSSKKSLWEILTNTLKKTAKEVDGVDVDDEEFLDLSASAEVIWGFEFEFEKVKKYFASEKEGKKLRRDQFQTKFGKEFLEKCLEKNLLETTTIWTFKFYSLAI